jgi:integrase
MSLSTKRVRVSKFQGVYFRESSTRRHQGKPDRCFDIAYKDLAGKLIWEKVGWLSEGYSPQIAADIRSKRVQAVRHGDELPHKRKREITFGEVWEKYLEWIKSNKSRSSDDEGYYRKHLEPRFGKKALSKITPLDLETMKTEILGQGLSPGTAKHNIVLVRQIINKAISWGLWHGENPVKKVKMPKLNNQRERFLSPDDAKLLLEELNNVSKQTHDIALMSLHTGMRAGEIFSLRWTDIDIPNGFINISETKDSRDGRSRKVFMTESVSQLLGSLPVGQPEDLVFPSRGTGKIVEVSKTFGRTIKRLGFNDGITDPRQKVCFHTGPVTKSV